MSKSKVTVLNIEDRNSDSTINIALDTLMIGKQCIIFVNTKRSAESVAEKISNIIMKDKKNVYKSFIEEEKLNSISNDILKAISSPTKQCHKLSATSKYGVAFHHSGLVSAQRKIIEENFKDRIVKIIVATPTLAMGVDLPAYRVIIRDLKRFGQWGMDYIPVLEYEQQAGRAGRPSYDTHGEAICIAEDNKEKLEIKEQYINGVPEPIISKLAVEPIMRTYILSLISSGFITNISELEQFFSETFYAKHYGDLTKLNDIINKMIDQLEEWKFLNVQRNENNANDSGKNTNAKDDFVSALKLSFKKNTSKEKEEIKLSATLLGRRVSELYLDPYTAHNIILSLETAVRKIDEINTYSFVHMICSCLELRPLLRVKVKEFDEYSVISQNKAEKLLIDIPELFDAEFEDFLNSIKTSELFNDWLEEKDEEYLMEKYDVRPGELHSKRERADWLIFSSEELSRLLKMHVLVKDLSKLRFRLKYGAKEELIPLLQLKNIGRVRARKLFDNRIKDISDVKNSDLTTLSQLIGKATALDIKKQVGEELSEDKVVVKTNKRKGQKNLEDYGED
ncbi:MAG TPA: helicase-related protein [Alphaproteobacteria bacterium]|nr:helicase-related protein [Alphaproteobacteria bacterium]